MKYTKNDGRVLSDVSIGIRGGEKIGIVGRSGAGEN